MKSFRAPGTPAGYPNPQSGYVTNPAQTYGQQRAPGYDQAAYQAAATQGTYASKQIVKFLISLIFVY